MTGVADAAALGAILSILMKLYPNSGSTVVSMTEMSFGLGAMLGKVRCYSNCIFKGKF